MLASGKGRGGPCCIRSGRSAPRGGFPGGEPDQRARKEAYIVVFERPAILSRGWGVRGVGRKCPPPNSE